MSEGKEIAKSTSYVRGETMRLNLKNSFLPMLVFLASCAQEQNSDQPGANSESARPATSSEANQSLGLWAGGGLSGPYGPLNISKSPIANAGDVTAQISYACGNNCKAFASSEFAVVNDSAVILKANPSAGYNFVRWEGPCEAGPDASVCRFVVSDTTRAAPFKAIFQPVDPVTVSVTIDSATNYGIIGELRSDLNCSKSVGAVCSVQVNRGTELLFKSVDASNDTRFVGWTGVNCSKIVKTASESLCSTTADAPITIAAKFEKAAYLSVNPDWSGNGKILVNGTPMYATDSCSAGSFGIFAGNTTSPIDEKSGRFFDCYSLTPESINGPSWDTIASSTKTRIAKVPFGTTVTLTAEGTGGNVLKAWTGACTGSSPTCTLVMDQARYVYAEFYVPPPPPACNITASTVTNKVVGYGTDIPVSLNMQTKCLAKTVTLVTTRSCTHEVVQSTLIPNAPLVLKSKVTSLKNTTTAYTVKDANGLALENGSFVIKGIKTATAPAFCQILSLKVQ